MMRKALTRSTFLVPNFNPNPAVNSALSLHTRRSCGPSFAPIVIAELESQLDTWRDHLSPALNFQDDRSGLELRNMTRRAQTPTETLSKYFQAQFHACKMTHQWPAVYEASLLLGDIALPSDGTLLAYEKFLNGYFIFTEACLAIGHQPIPHLYTLSCSMFVLSLAVLEISMAHPLQAPTNLVYGHISDAVEGILGLMQFSASRSLSVNHFYNILRMRLEEWQAREK
jgi:hypothetical protein